VPPAFRDISLFSFETGSGSAAQAHLEPATLLPSAGFTGVRLVPGWILNWFLCAQPWESPWTTAPDPRRVTLSHLHPYSLWLALWVTEAPRRSSVLGFNALWLPA
jgi:hypothetical protein